MWSELFSGRAIGTYVLYSNPSPEMDLVRLENFEGSHVGQRKVSAKTVNKRRNANYAARQARKKQRQKGLGKVKFYWSPTHHEYYQTRKK